MSSGKNANEDDDDLAKLMPNVANLIRLEESTSMESKGSTSMSFSGNSVRHKIGRQNPKPSRRRQGESVFREVANKFLRRGATSKRATKPPVLATLSSNCSSITRRIGGPSSGRWRNTNTLEKENMRPEMTTPAKQGTRLAQQQKMEMKDASQKVARKFKKRPPCSEGSNYFSVNSKIQRADKSNTTSGSEQVAQSDAPSPMRKASCNSEGVEHVSNLARKSERRKARLFRTTVPLNLSELKEEFAEIDGEALEEEEVSITNMPRIAAVVASETLLDRGDEIREDRVETQNDLSRNEPEKEVSNIAKAPVEEAVLPIYSPGHRKEGVGICAGQSMSSKPRGHDQDVPVSEPAGKLNDAVMNSGHDPNATPSPMRHLNAPSENVLDDGNRGDNNQGRNGENPPRIEHDSASPIITGLNDQARTPDTKPTSCHLEACAVDVSGKDAGICAELEEAYDEGGKNHTIGCSATQPNLYKSKATVEDGPDENAAHRDGSVPHLSSTFRDVQSSVPKAKNLPEQENVVDIPLQGRHFSAGDTFPTSPHLHYSRRWRTVGMNQRRLAFESEDESDQKAMVRSLQSDSGGVSVSTVEFKGRTNSAAGITDRDGGDYDANMTSLPDQEAQPALPDGEVVGELDGRDCKDQSSNAQAVSQMEGDVDREKLLTSSLAQEGHLPAFEGTGEMGKDDYCFRCLSPKAGGQTECLKIRGGGKRTWANLGDPIGGHLRNS